MMADKSRIPLLEVDYLDAFESSLYKWDGEIVVVGDLGNRPYRIKIINKPIFNGMG